VTATLYAGSRQEASDVVEDLSAHGAFVVTPAPPPLRSPVVLDITAPGIKHSIHLTGHVVTLLPLSGAGAHHPPGVGVAFDPPSRLTEDRLHALLARLEALQGDKTVEGIAVEEEPLELTVPPPPSVAPVPVPDAQHLLAEVRELLVDLSREQQHGRALEQENARLKGALKAARLELVALKGKTPAP
jgi:hypothetical protein